MSEAALSFRCHPDGAVAGRSRSAQPGFTASRRSAQQGFTASRRSAQQGFTAPRRSAQQGFTASWRSAQQGFTLIEMLVALMIFALLASAGVVLLRGSVDTQKQVAKRLDALADVQRGIATLDSDLSQAAVRISRTEAGTSAPAFFGRRAQSAEPLMEFVRGGWSNPSGQRHPALQRIAYWWREGRLERVDYPALDGARPSEPAVLFDAVSEVALRYRAPDGEWRDQWAPAKPEDMPAAVEIQFKRKAAGTLTLRFLLGPRVEPRETIDPSQGPDDAA